MASGYHELGNLHLSDQQLDEALEAYERALGLEIKTRDLPGLAATHAQVGLVQKERFVFKEAVRSLMIAQELFRRLNSPNSKAITPVLDAAREMVDAWENRSIETEVEEWLEQLIYGQDY
jgi:tetratricopeptide (TPR) repeat protein